MSELNNPSEHAKWALRNLPMVAGVGAVTHPSFLKGWSEHLWKCGFRHIDWFREQADEDGNIHVSKLPEQEIKYQHPFRGPHHPLNNAARWVSPSDGEPEPMRIPNIKELTDQENKAMLQQYTDAGLIKDGKIGPPLGGEVS